MDNIISNIPLFNKLLAIKDISSMSDVEILNFIKGPLFELSLLIFIFGLLYKLFKILTLGIPKNRAKPKGSPTFSAIKMLLMKPIYVFGFRDVLTKRAITFLNGFLFHIFFILLIFFIPWHAFIWDKLFSVELPYFNGAISNILAYGALVTLIILWVYRLVNPVTKLLTTFDEHFANFLIVAVLISGIIANKWAGDGVYPTLLSLHILIAELLIIYIPFSRLSHFMTYFISTYLYGRSIGISGARE